MRFSVIVPVYKVENYLPQCIDSVLEQDFTDFELILVVDGSPDNCLEICNSYRAKDDRIKVIDKQNGGLTSARKAGANIAKGQYVICVDGDDCIEPGYFSCADRIISKTEADMIAFGYNELNHNTLCQKMNKADKGLYSGEQYKSISARYIYDRNDSDTMNTGSFIFSLWSKVIKREIYQKAQMMIDNKIIIGEDAVCVALCLNLSESIYVSDLCFYDYRIVETSIMNSFDAKRFLHLENTIREFQRLSVINDEKVIAYCFRSMANNLAILAISSSSYYDFRNKLKTIKEQSFLFELLALANQLKMTSKNRLKYSLLTNDRYWLYYCFSKINNRKSKR